jgi:pyruvyl transferase EpsO
MKGISVAQELKLVYRFQGVGISSNNAASTNDTYHHQGDARHERSRERTDSSPTSAKPGANLVLALRDRLKGTLSEIVPSGSRVAIVEWPSYPNVGDHLIFLGTISVLQELDAKLVYTAELGGYSKRALASAIGDDGIILLSGGGNFGDRYPAVQQLREHILLDFPHTRIINLPQTLDFQNSLARDRAAAIVGAHRDIHLLWRDAVSMVEAEKAFDAFNILAPDCAFALANLPAVTSTSQSPAPQIWLTRTDGERSTKRLLPPADEPSLVSDWATASGPFRSSVSGHLHHNMLRGIRAASRSPMGHRYFGSGLGMMRRKISQRRLNVGMALISQGDILVTDRLHGHVLGLLLNKPHVVVDTGYGKIDRFVSTWTSNAPLLKCASTSAEAASAARTLRVTATTAAERK